MSKIRILIVDDSVVFRKLLSEEFAKDPALEVAGTAANGRIALQKLTQVNPDLVILDIEMPEMDGLATLTELRKTHPRLPVIMFSSLTERGAEATLEALKRGATDYFTKPTTGSLSASLDVLQKELIPEIKELCKSKLDQPRPTAAMPATPIIPTSVRQIAPGAVRVVAIGTSTGGPNALAEVFRHLPKNFPVPIVLVQHMPPMFTKLLADRLTADSAIRVQEGSSGCVLTPGECYIAPGDYHMITVQDGRQIRLLVHQDPPENSCRPAVDPLFRSVAKVFGSGVLAVILTGMGQDGLRGCEAIRAVGGQILAQDEQSSVVWGMPGYVAKAGLADRVLPLALVGPEIVRRTCGEVKA